MSVKIVASEADVEFGQEFICDHGQELVRSAMKALAKSGLDEESLNATEYILIGAKTAAVYLAVMDRMNKEPSE